MGYQAKITNKGTGMVCEVVKIIGDKMWLERKDKDNLVEWWSIGEVDVLFADEILGWVSVEEEHPGLKQGDIVRVRSTGKSGTIVAIDNVSAYVNVGNDSLSTCYPVSNLEPYFEDEEKKEADHFFRKVYTPEEQIKALDSSFYMNPDTYKKSIIGVQKCIPCPECGKEQKPGLYAHVFEGGHCSSECATLSTIKKMVDKFGYKIVPKDVCEHNFAEFTLTKKNDKYSSSSMNIYCCGNPGCGLVTSAKPIDL